MELKVGISEIVQVVDENPDVLVGGEPGSIGNAGPRFIPLDGDAAVAVVQGGGKVVEVPVSGVDDKVSPITSGSWSDYSVTVTIPDDAVRSAWQLNFMVDNPDDKTGVLKVTCPSVRVRRVSDDADAVDDWVFSESTVSGEVALVNPGGAPSPVTLRVDGPVVNPPYRAPAVRWCARACSEPGVGPLRGFRQPVEAGPGGWARPCEGCRHQAWVVGRPAWKEFMEPVGQGVFEVGAPVGEFPRCLPVDKEHA